MCGVKDCKSPDAPETARWKSELRICSKHLKDIRSYIHGDKPGLTASGGFYDGSAVTLPNPLPPIVDDYVKIIVLLQFNQDLCMKTLREGYQEYAKGKKHTWTVSKALAHYEGLCWFPDNKMLLLGYLSSSAFEAQISLGVNTDPGAGKAHGSLSHRFQWHVIMRLMTDGFKKPYLPEEGWSTSPLDLFMSYSTGYGQPYNAWGKSMDLQLHPGWGNPDNILAQIRASDMQQFKSSVDHRFERASGRIKAINDAMADLMESKIIPPAAITQSAIKEAVASQVHAYKKVGGPDPAAVVRVKSLMKGSWGLSQVEDVAIAVYITLNAKASTRTYAVSSKPTRYRPVAPLVLSGRSEKLIQVDAARISSSQNNLNRSDFSMSKLGAQPTKR